MCRGCGFDETGYDRMTCWLRNDGEALNSDSYLDSSKIQ